MRRTKKLLFWPALALLTSAAGVAQNMPQASIPSNALAIPAGAHLELAVTRAVWSARVKPGDTLYAEAVFPVTVGQSIAIPAGSYVEGQIEAVTLPTRRSNRATFDLRLTKVILGNGYVAPLQGTAAEVIVQVSRASDILLDNGTQFELTLGAPVTLDGDAVRDAIAVTHAPKPGEFTHATLCRPTPGSEGSPGTVLPGTPATPPTVIPGAPGMPDTVIPGTPGTSSQVIGAVPGTPGTICPAPPLVVSVVAQPSSKS